MEFFETFKRGNVLKKMYSFFGVMFILQMIDYHKFVANAQTTEVTAPRYSRLGSRIEVTCSFTGSLLAVEWRKTTAGAPNSEEGETLLSYIAGRTVEGPGKSRGMDMSTDNYSLIINSVMCEDTGAFWCSTTLVGVSPTEKNDTTEVYNFTQPIMVEPSDQVAVDCDGQDADFCVMEGFPLQCQVLGLKPRNENDIDLQVSPGNDEGSDIQKTSYTYNENGVDYTFYNAETSVKAIWNDGLTQEYICTVATAAFTQSSNPLRINVKKATAKSTSASQPNDLNTLDAVLVVGGTYTDALADPQSSAFQDLQTTIMTGMATIDGVNGTTDYSFSSGSIKASFTIQLEPNTDFTTEKLEMEIETAFSNGSFTGLTFISAEVTDVKVTDTNTKSGTQNDKNIPVYIGLGVGVPVLIIVACIVALIVWKIMTKNKVKPGEKQKDERKES